MKPLIKLILGLLFVLFAVYILPSKLYSLFVYALFVLFFTYGILQIIRRYYKIKNGKNSVGKIIEYEKADSNEILIDKYKIKVEFISPVDNMKYCISDTIEKIPEDGLCRIIINEKKPRHSIVVKEFDVYEFLMSVAFWLVFGTLLVYRVFKAL